MKRNGQYSGSLQECLNDTNVMWKCRYFYHLSNYLQYHDPNNILVLFLEDLKNDPQAYIKQIRDFFGIDDHQIPDLQDMQSLPASQSRSELMTRVVKHGARIMRKMGGARLVSHVKYSFWYKVFFKKIEASERPQFTDAEVQELKAYYQDEIDQLSEWTKRDLNQLWFSS